jgi:hypothetical protein
LGAWLKTSKADAPVVRRNEVWQKGPKQVKLGALKLVVPLHEVERLEARLRKAREPDSIEPDSEIEAMLVELQRYPLSKEMLVKTRVGRVVNKLKSHRNSAVRQAAKLLIVKWTAVLDTPDRPKIEVTTAQPLWETNAARVRESARGAIAARLQGGGSGAAGAGAGAGRDVRSDDAGAADDGRGGGGVGGAPSNSSSSNSAAIAIEVEDQLFSYSHLRTDKNYNRNLAALMRRFDCHTNLPDAIRNHVNKRELVKLRPFFAS